MSFYVLYFFLKLHWGVSNQIDKSLLLLDLSPVLAHTPVNSPVYLIYCVQSAGCFPPICSKNNQKQQQQYEALETSTHLSLILSQVETLLLLLDLVLVHTYTSLVSLIYRVLSARVLSSHWQQISSKVAIAVCIT